MEDGYRWLVRAATTEVVPPDQTKRKSISLLCNWLQHRRLRQNPVERVPTQNREKRRLLVLATWPIDVVTTIL
jgi:hypothetical protein